MRDILTNRIRIRVFLSSTYHDLRDAREHLRIGLDRLKWAEVRWMEGESSKPIGILSGSLAMLEDSHVYVGLIGSQYGTVLEDDRGRLSVTEREFDCATELQLCRIVFISRSRQSRLSDDPALSMFIEKIQGAIWPDYFINKYHLAEIVKDALSNIWNDLHGRILVTALTPWEDFARSVQPYVQLRSSIASDAGVEPFSVMLGLPEALIPEATTFPVLLPHLGKSRYLRLGSGKWSGSVIHATDHDRDDPTSIAEHWEGLRPMLNPIVQRTVNRRDRIRFIEELLSRR